MNATITHNLTTLLRIGAFEDTHEASLCAMSQHKWRTLIKASHELGVQPYVARAAQMISQNLTPLPDTNAKLNADTLSPELLKLNDEVAPYDVSDAHLYNILTQRSYENVTTDEEDSLDYSRDTLHLLHLIVANADNIITEDVSVEGIISIGTFIRQHSSTIDYDKLNGWLAKIGLVQIASLEGSMLITCMGFTAEELPFVKTSRRSSRKLFMQPINKAFEQHSCSNAVRMNVAMLETISHRFITAITRITDIEE